LLDQADVDAVRARGLKVVIDYAFGTASILMPQVLERLGVDVLAVNPYTAESRVRPTTEDPVARLAELVRSSGSDFGIRFDADGERADLVDDTGRLLDWTTATLFYVRMVGQAKPGSRIVLPVSASSQAQRLAAAAGCEIVWSQTSAHAVMAACSAPGVVFAAGDQGVVLPSFLCGFDAAAQFVLTVDLLSREAVGRMRLSEIVDLLPPVYMASQVVATPWERKGAVMRTLVEEADPASLVLIDGVKVHADGGWALVLPDRDEPVCHIWAESDSARAAAALAAGFKARIEQIAST
jgi:mannose-1-phosphate guanylyltransferase/phosphomannomutase